MTSLMVEPLWKSIHKNSLIGFDELFNRIQQLEKPQSSFPPYNIIRNGETEIIIKLAVAGFSKEDISVVLEDNKLVISGSSESDPVPVDYIYKGIAERNFKRVFTIADSVEVTKVILENGMLSVILKNIVPEKKEKVFRIEEK